MSKSPKVKKPFRLSYRDRSLTFTPLGTRFVVISVLIGFAAINTGSNLLYLCTSMMLSMMLVSGILSEQALKGLKVARRLPEEIYAGTAFTVRYGLTNTKRRIPSFALTVSGYHPDGREGADGFVLRLPPAGEGGCDATETVTVRGGWKTDGFEVSTRFPFGLFRKSRRMPTSETRVVYPRIVPLPVELPRELTAGYGETPSGLKGQGAEVIGVREYQATDEARLIHWKSSARLSRLMAKEFEAEHKKTVCVILDDSLPPGPATEATAMFEGAVALVGAVVRRLVLEDGLPVAFVSRGFSLPAGIGREQYLAVMEGLALIGPSGAGVGHAGDSEDALKTALAGGPSVMVLPGPGSGWASHAGSANVVLEAGR